MKNLPPSEMFEYSASEVMELLAWARHQGATFARVGNVEVAWKFSEPAKAPHAPIAYSAQTVRQGVQPVLPAKEAARCPDCRDFMVPGTWGRPYCVRCYKERQDRKR